MKHSVRVNDNVNFDLDEVLEDEILPLGDTTIPEKDEEGRPNLDADSRIVPKGSSCTDLGSFWYLTNSA